jgi:hypothetical protein
MRIDGQTIATPTELKVSIYRLSKADRTASGDMVMEVIALKRRLDLKWAIIPSSNLAQIMGILDSGVFHTVEYVDPRNGESATITAYVGDINQNAWQQIGGSRYWRDVSLALIQR